MNDELLFAEDTDTDDAADIGVWKVLIVDDEPEVHAITRLALKDFVFQNKRLDFMSAYSGDEARQIFRQHRDIAVVLLDVVMETDHAGLEVADFIRNDVHNHFTRIILRTGQPGQAPERDVIINYDINDYKSKTELTAQKLFTVVIAALRSYRDIMVIEEARSGLEKIISASVDLFSTRSLETFMRGIIQQLASIVGCARDAAYVTSAVAVPEPIYQSRPSELFVFAGNGEYADKEGKPLEEAVPAEALALCQRALKEQSIVFSDDQVVVYCRSTSAHGSLLVLSGFPRRISETDKRLVSLFAENVQIAFDNIMNSHEVELTQREIITRLVNTLESNGENSRHLTRMIAMSEVMARAVGLHDIQIKTFKYAIPLHDIGNSRVPASILNKAEPLSDDERFLIRQHAEFGYQILKDSDKPTIQLAATLARQHHERWDGTGYPNGVLGENIAIESRIAALLDVFDALLNQRPYKAAWPLEQVKATLMTERGKHFDPLLVDTLMQHLDELMAIQQQYPDIEE